MEKVDHYAKIIWDYMILNQTLSKSDCILVFGSRDLAPAYRACELFFQGYASIIIFSGNHGPEHTLPKPEAEIYADIAFKQGVPREAVYIENKSCNSGENVLFSRSLIETERIPHSKIIIVQKPYMERRVYATLKKQWPGPEIIITSEQITFEDYVNNNKYDSKERIINRMIGDLQRIREYPKLGFQIEQEIPDEVWQAGQELIKIGYDKYLIK